ncbi:AAEL004636-PA, partial [Aedes aegypti]
MEKLKLELAQLDVLFSRRREMKQQTGSGKGRPAVVGFEFPLKAEDDVERLEVAVNSDATIRSQYIQLLKAKKLKHIDLVDCFPMLFGSSSMEGYTWSGCRMVKFPKKSMKNYSIFNDCML